MSVLGWPPAEPGPLRFDRFMEAALYHPEHGFFGSGAGRPGRRGDFLTSVEVGPLFGAVVARALDAWWFELGRPDPYTVVDAGAGTGTLARTVLAAEPACGPALDLVLVERAGPLCAGHPRGPRVRTVDALPDPPFRGVIIANELLDNLPVRLLERVDGGWLEVWVDGDRPVLRPTDLTGPPGPAPSGARVARADAARTWVADALVHLDGGVLAVLDYTTTTADMARRAPDVWLRTYRGHQSGDEPWRAPGTQDITCEVPIDQLPEPDRVTTQADWLRRFGLDELVDEGRRQWAEGAHRGDLAALRARSRVREGEALTDPCGLGAFTVAEWRVGVGRPRSGGGRLPHLPLEAVQDEPHAP